MIDTSPQSLIERIRASEKIREGLLSKLDAQVQAYHAGSCGGGDTKAVAENHIFEYVSMRIGQVAFSNPVVRVLAAGGSQRRDEAKASQHALNRWLRDTNFKSLAEKLAMDTFFAYGVTITKPEPAPGFDEYEDPIYWPSVTRLDPRCFGIDDQALTLETARLLFHQVIGDKRDLQRLAREDAGKPENERAGWVASAIEDMTAGAGTDTGAGKTKDKTSDDAEHQVSWYEVWIPGVRIKDENTPDKGYHGAIFTIAYDAKEGKGSEIRKARDFWGPRWGPYTVYGIYTVPNSPWPLGPVQVAWKQIDDDNTHADVIDRSAKNYKRLMLVDETDRKLAKKIKDGKHDFVYTQSGFAKDKVVQLELGGITEEMLAVKGITKDRADRMLGMSDAEKGMVTGDATATENAVAANAASVRTSWQTKKFWDACERNLKTVLHDLKTEDVIVPLGEEAEMDLGAESPAYVGKITAEAWPRQRRTLMQMYPGMDLPLEVPPEALEDAGKGVDDMEVAIEIGSMARKDEAVEKMEADNFLMSIINVGNAMPMMPHVVWGPLLDEWGQRRGYPDISRYFNLEALAALQGINVQNMVAGEEGGGGGSQGGQQAEAAHNQPRMSRTQRSTPDSRSQKASLPGQVSGARNGAQQRSA